MFEKPTKQDLSNVFKPNKRNIERNVMDYIKFQIFSLNLRCVLYFVFFTSGVDIFVGRRNNLKRKITIWFCRIITFSCISYNTIGHVFHYLNGGKEETKFQVSIIILYVLATFLWISVVKVNGKLLKIVNDISKLKQSIKPMSTNIFVNVCILLTIFNLVIFIFMQFYPFTYEKIQRVLKNLDHFNISSKVNSYVYYVYIVVCYALYVTYFPLFNACVLILYVIFCHDIQTILSAYVSKKMPKVSFELEDGKGYFNYYNTCLIALERFESAMSLPIFLVYDSFILVLITNLLMTVEGGRNTASDVSIVRSFIAITLLSFMATWVHVADAVAKRSNLERLETMLKAGKSFEFNEMMRVWRFNNCPAFMLTAGGFFKFNRENYLSAVGYLVTYILLIINL